MQAQLKLKEIDPATCVVKGTHQQLGRTISVTPQNSASRNLFYGRIRIEPSGESLSFGTGTHETGLICLDGSATIGTGEGEFKLNRYDALYVPRDSEISVTTEEGCDIAELSSPVENRYPIQHVIFDEIRKDPALHFVAGKPPTERDLNILLGKNVQAGRIMAGVTFSSDGNWTSFPPHEHHDMLEEAYLYIDMPAPQWGIQLVYTNLDEPELVQVVHEGDVVIMPKGYHPNVAAPGGSINFLWMMAANREDVDRQFGVVNVQPEYAQGGSGLEASRK
jgi:5-deoxy-glucuronate isomerase